jgi:hypothetical protein
MNGLRIPVAIVHHANQYLITNGYRNRAGINEIIGRPDASSGLRAVLELHSLYGIPLHLHVSGTLIEACAWFEPRFLEEIAELYEYGLLEVIGSTYSQNIMPLFDHEFNLMQIQEELRLIEAWLKVHPSQVRGFWVPERVWNTEQLSPVLTDATLANGGFRYTLADDRLFLTRARRHRFDAFPSFRPELFEAANIREGNGLTGLPLSSDMRLNIPVETDRQRERLDLLFTRLGKEMRKGRRVIAIYGDDMEKAAGLPPWNPQAVSHYRRFLEWMTSKQEVEPVLLNQWLNGQKIRSVRTFEQGTYRELAGPFGAGEDYMGWAGSPAWAPYQKIMMQAWEKLKLLSQRNDAAPSLLGLARKHLLACSYETGWHDAPKSVHTDQSSETQEAALCTPAPWTRALASHARSAYVLLEAAKWATDPDVKGSLIVSEEDLDEDGHKEVILRNETVAAVITPRFGGRIVYSFHFDNNDGVLVTGNPSDDWNWLEQLNDYMDAPPNHPGALADHGFEHDRFETISLQTADGVAELVLVNKEADSPAFGLIKRITLVEGSRAFGVRYDRIPSSVLPLSIDIGFSPDYLRLLSEGRQSVVSHKDGNKQGFRTDRQFAWVRLQSSGISWSIPRSPVFGHGFGLTLTLSAPSASFEIGIESK